MSPEEVSQNYLADAKESPSSDEGQDHGASEQLDAQNS